LVSVVEYLIKTYRIKVLRLIMGRVLFLDQICRREYFCRERGGFAGNGLNDSSKVHDHREMSKLLAAHSGVDFCWSC
jgi:hypothetical protein